MRRLSSYGVRALLGGQSSRLPSSALHVRERRHVAAPMMMVQSRNMGFWSSFREALTRRKEESKEFQEAKRKLEEDATLKEASEKARQAAEATKRAAEVAANTAIKAKDVVGKKAGEISEEVKERLEDIADTQVVGEAGKVLGKTATKVGDASVSVVTKVADVAAKMKDTTIGKKVTEQFKENDGPVSPRVTWKPIDKETHDVIIRPASEWDRRWQQIVSTPVVGPLIKGVATLRNATKEVAADAGDKVFGETETGIVMGEIKKIEPHFHLPRFLLHVQQEMVPAVLSAYLEGDLPKLRPFCLERGYQILGSTIRDRKAKGHTVDCRILHVGEVELVTGRLVEDTPVLLLTFCVQQVYCVKDKTGKILEGSEGNIRSVHYMWAMMVDPDSADSDWKLLEMHIQGDFPQIA